MARTKASVGAKVSSGKSSKVRCSVPAAPSNSGSSGGSEKSSRNYSSGNPVCARETPKWQKPITTFFVVNSDSSHKDSDDVVASSSKSKPKRNIIESDDEETSQQTDIPKNTELDESIQLEPLTGEDSHKIEEYYGQNKDKGKGKGKKSNKENFDGNVRNKRELDKSFENEVRKKLKV